MEIADLRIKITFQKCTVSVDSCGNHISVWTDYYTCHAVGGDEESFIGSEKETAGQINDFSRMSFTVRPCSLLSALNAQEYRIVFNGEIYNILRIKHFDFKNRQLKLFCQKVRR